MQVSFQSALIGLNAKKSNHQNISFKSGDDSLSNADIHRNTSVPQREDIQAYYARLDHIKEQGETDATLAAMAARKMKEEERERKIMTAPLSTLNDMELKVARHYLKERQLLLSRELIGLSMHIKNVDKCPKCLGMKCMNKKLDSFKAAQQLDEEIKKRLESIESELALRAEKS